MKSLKYILFIGLIFLFNCVCRNSFAAERSEVIVCGDDKVLIIDLDKSTKDHVSVIWSWKVAEALSLLPADYRKLMIPLDECKSVDNNSKLLLTSSGGGVLLLERESKRCLFYARAPMAHSAEMLPGNLIAVALSTHPQGNSVELYQIGRSEQVLYRDSLYSGHGAVWMDELNRLFALGYDELRSYSLRNGNSSSSPRLQLEKSWKIPVEGGHDLTKVSDSVLLLTGHEGACLFDTGKGLFSPFKPLEKEKNVKSVNYDEESGGLVYTRAEIDWWTHHVYSRKPDKVLTIEDINLYKARVIRK